MVQLLVAKNLPFVKNVRIAVEGKRQLGGLEADARGTVTSSGPV